MSRIGKQTIVIPEKVTVNLTAGQVAVSGPKGELTRSWPAELDLALAAGAVKVRPKAANQDRRAALAPLWGTYTAHLKNMIAGVSEGFVKRLVIEGIGYKTSLAGGAVNLNVGFSHPVSVPIPAKLKVVIEKNLITVSGPDREAVGQLAASLRAVRPPDPYKEKGLRYDDEKVTRKPGKKTVAAA